MIDLAAAVHVDPAVLEYVAPLAEETRDAPDVRARAVSVRGGLALVRAAKTLGRGAGPRPTSSPTT